jgi:hypothetical protein
MSIGFMIFSISTVFSVFGFVAGLFRVALQWRLTLKGFAMWWHSVSRQPKLIDKVEYCSFGQHLFVSHHITKPML